MINQSKYNSYDNKGNHDSISVVIDQLTRTNRMETDIPSLSCPQPTLPSAPVSILSHLTIRFLPLANGSQFNAQCFTFKKFNCKLTRIDVKLSSKLFARSIFYRVTVSGCEPALPGEQLRFAPPLILKSRKFCPSACTQSSIKKINVSSSM